LLIVIPIFHRHVLIGWPVLPNS